MVSIFWNTLDQRELKQVEPILNFQVTAEGLARTGDFTTYTLHNFGAP